MKAGWCGRKCAGDGGWRVFPGADCVADVALTRRWRRKRFWAGAGDGEGESFEEGLK